MDGISTDQALQACAPTTDASREGELIDVQSRRAPWSRRAFLASMALSATGCSTSLKQYVDNGFKVGVNFGRPPTAAAQHWIDADDQRVRSEEADDSHWWTVFSDPVLSNLVQTAYQQNLTLRQAGYRVLEARLQLGIANGYLFPQTQEAIGGYSRRGVSLQNPNAFATPTRFFSIYSLGFNMAWELDFWGRFRRAIEVADDNLDASVENYDDVLVTLIADIASNYVQYRTSEQELVYIRTNIGIQEETFDIAQARFKGGQATELDVDQAQSNLSQTRSEVANREIEMRTASNQLCILMGIPTEDLSQLLGTGPIPTAPREVALGVPADLVRRRPDVRRQERLAAAQCAQIGIAETDFYPAISILGSVGYSSRNFQDMFSSQAFNGAIGPQFQWKILNYNRIKNNVALQEAKFEELVAGYQNSVLNAHVEVENGLVKFLWSQRRSVELSESVDAAQKAVKVAITLYRAGATDFNRVALLQQNLVQQQILLARAMGQIGQGLIEVYKALGGGWQLRLDYENAGTLPAPMNFNQGPAPTPANPPAPVPAEPRGEAVPEPEPAAKANLKEPTKPK